MEQKTVQIRVTKHDLNRAIKRELSTENETVCRSCLVAQAINRVSGSTHVFASVGYTMFDFVSTEPPFSFCTGKMNEKALPLIRMFDNRQWEELRKVLPTTIEITYPILPQTEDLFAK